MKTKTRELEVRRARDRGHADHGWLQLIRGRLRVDDEILLDPGDGLSAEFIDALTVSAETSTEALLFDLH